MEYRLVLRVRGPAARPAGDWETLHRTLDRMAAEYGPVMSYSDDASPSAGVILSTEADRPVRAAAELTSVLYRAIDNAGLADCYIGITELEPVAD
jgi:hypothetical protein